MAITESKNQRGQWYFVHVLALLTAATTVLFFWLQSSFDLTAMEHGKHPSFDDTRASVGELQFEAWGVTPSQPERWDGLRKRIAALSKGYGRRVLLALALLTPHPLVMMDEPFDGFDLRQTREVMGVVREVARNGRTLVLAIHQLIDAERVCDRFVLLADGRIRGIGTLADLRAQTGMPAGGLEDVFLALT